MTQLTASSQNALFSFPALENTVLNSEQTERFNRLISNSTYSAVRPVQIGSIENAQNKGKIEVEIPNESCGKKIFTALKVEYKSANEYSWYGRDQSRDTCSCGDASILIIKEGASIYGKITIDNRVYTIHDLSGNKNALTTFIIENSESSGEVSACGVQEEKMAKENIKEISASARGGGPDKCEVRVLVVYTKKAKNSVGVGDVVNMTRTAIKETNLAFSNSAVNSISLVEAGIEEVSFVENDINDVNLMGADTEIANKKAAKDADLVMLVTDGTGMGNTCGNGQAVGPIKDKANALMQLKGFCYYTFTHEIGHLLGCRHSSDPTIDYAKSHDWRSCGSAKKTVMYRINTANHVILHFSNPDVNYKSKSTGVKDVADNARKINTVGCEVADFVSPPIGAFSVSITGFSVACINTNICLNATIYPGACSSCTYEWYKSDDGINYGSVLSSSNNFCDLTPLYETYIYYKVVVFNSQLGKTETAYYTMIVDSGDINPCNYLTNPKNNINKISNNNSGSSTIYPTPATDMISLSIELLEEEKVDIRIYDFSGRYLKTLYNEKCSKGVSVLDFDVSQFSTGTYFVNINNSSSSEVKKLIILKQ